MVRRGVALRLPRHIVNPRAIGHMLPLTFTCPSKLFHSIDPPTKCPLVCVYTMFYVRCTPSWLPRPSMRLCSRLASFCASPSNRALRATTCARAAETVEIMGFTSVGLLGSPAGGAAGFGSGLSGFVGAVSVMLSGLVSEPLVEDKAARAGVAEHEADRQEHGGDGW